jgi:hypothetical protein
MQKKKFFLFIFAFVCLINSSNLQNISENMRSMFVSGTPRDIKEIIIGRCHEYLRLKKWEACSVVGNKADLGEVLQRQFCNEVFSAFSNTVFALGCSSLRWPSYEDAPLVDNSARISLLKFTDLTQQTTIGKALFWRGSTSLSSIYDSYVTYDLKKKVELCK